MSISRIARVTGLDRKTVRGCARKVWWRAYQREAAVAPQAVTTGD